MIVLDASALLAYLFRESGHEMVEKTIEDACISTVNLSEVVRRFIRDGIDISPLIQYIEKTSIEIVPFSQKHALHAADLIPKTKRYGLSLGDRACLGLATARNLAALTADVVWTDIQGLNVDVIQIR
ncbi:MAG: type II toxin-antitoxin system VapC family toxin [Methylococcales bacterium]